jgi:hypothetical protein
MNKQELKELLIKDNFKIVAWIEYVPFTQDDYKLFMGKMIKSHSGIYQILGFDENCIYIAHNRYTYQYAFIHCEFFDVPDNKKTFGKLVKVPA